MVLAEQRLRFGSVAMLLVLAVAMLGVGYALWSKILTVEGTINTGKVDAVWYFASCTENPENEPPGEVEGKEVGDFLLEPNPNDQEILEFTILNGYPSYTVDCEVHFANSGDIPVKIRGIVEIDPNGTAVSERLIDGINTQLEPCGFTPEWGTSPLDQRFPDLPGGQQCDKAMSLVVHVEQEALQNAGRGEVGDPPPYTFQYQVCVAQWNEEPVSSEECVAAAVNAPNG